MQNIIKNSYSKIKFYNKNTEFINDLNNFTKFFYIIFVNYNKVRFEKIKDIIDNN